MMIMMTFLKPEIKKSVTDLVNCSFH